MVLRHQVTEINNEILQKMMERALWLSTLSTTKTYPNPKVGAVIFDDSGQIVSEGFTQEYGGDHAEASALRKIGFAANGLNMAVTLEPCNHFGKTPPCSEAVLKAEIKRVFIAKREENPKAQNGAAFLAEHGVEVRFCEEFASKTEEINRFFFKGIRENLPWITVKAATSADGFITEKIGEKTLITGDSAQIYVHGLRSSHMAIAVGAGTVNIDDPLLTVRRVQGFDPQPVIFSKTLNLKINSQILKRDPIIFTASGEQEKLKALGELGCKVEVMEKNFRIIDTLRLLFEKYRINSLLVEGGAKLIGSFLSEGAVDEFQILRSKAVFGGGVALFDKIGLEIFKRNYELKEKRELDCDLLEIFRKIKII